MRISHLLNYIIQAYVWLVIVRLFLTWIPTIDWEKPALQLLQKVCDIYLSPFRKIMPPMGGLDFSPIIAILFLQVVGGIICTNLFRMGY